MRTKIPIERLASKGQLGSGALVPGPRAQGNRKGTINETTKITLNETATKNE